MDGHERLFSDTRRFIKDVFFPKVALPPELQVQITAVALFWWERKAEKFQYFKQIECLKEPQIHHAHVHSNT